MEDWKKVEELRVKANVSYEDARQAMEACNFDMLDAMKYLEKQGKVNEGSTASYTTASGTDTSQEFEQAQKSYEDSCQRTTLGTVIDKILKWCLHIFKKSVEVDFCITKNGREVLKVPVLVLILAFFISFGLVAILLIVGLFNDCKYTFQGVNATTIDINQICDKASETCENIKKDFQNK